MKIIYVTNTKQVERFVRKLNKESWELTEQNAYTSINEPFLLILPTYGAEEDLAKDFLEYQDNKEYCKGILGSGNRNFNQDFCFSAKNVSAYFKITNVLNFEFSGTDRDVQFVLDYISSVKSQA